MQKIIDINGSNELIKNGEKSITSFEELSDYLEKVKNIKLSNEKICIPEELIDVYISLNTVGKDINQISIETKLNIDEILYKLTLLEMQGLVKKSIGGVYVRKQ